MTVARGEVKKLLITIGELQSRIGIAMALHGNDRDPNGFQKGQEELQIAFNMCVNATSKYAPILSKNTVGDVKR